MVFQHQYQYQYQYQYQTQFGLQYQSFAQLVHEIPLNILLLSVVIALLPFLIYIFWKRPSFKEMLASTQRAFSFITRRYKERGIKERVETEYLAIKGKGVGIGTVLSSGNYLLTVLLFFLVLKKMIFFGLVTSLSMAPMLMTGDLVLCEALSVNTLNVGDIIVFVPPRQTAPVIHRIASISDSGIKTKGDNEIAVDEWLLKKSDIKGKAVTIRGKPFTVKNIGLYLMPVRTYIPGSNPAYEAVRDIMQSVHNYGPVFMLSIILLIVLINSGISSKEHKYPAYR